MSHQALYESIDLDMIQAWIGEQREETVHLDFKLVNDPSMNREDRKSLAKALSGFANSEGGIVVWGVNASRTRDDVVDCAREIRPIENLALFLSRLNEFTSEVSPSVDGVLHRSIPTGDNQGLAVTIVPESDSGPHMAKATIDQYFKRTGDRFAKMEHFDIADMFGRRKRPKLSVVLTPLVGSVGRYYESVLQIYNYGRGSAIAPSVSIWSDPPRCITSSLYGVDGNRNFGLGRIISARGNDDYSFGGNTTDVIHPESHLDVTLLTVEEQIVNAVRAGTREVIIHTSVGAMDSPLINSSIYLSELLPNGE